MVASRLPCAARAGRGLAKLGYASNNASPDPPGPALLSHAQGIAQPAPLARLGVLVTVAGNQQPDLVDAGFIAISLGADYVYFAGAKGHFHAGIRQNIPHSFTVSTSLTITEANAVNRTVFLILYAVGIVAIWLSGNPWSRVNFLLLKPTEAAHAFPLSLWVALLVPLLLVGVAAIRGPKIGRPKLYLLPMLAFGLSALAFVYGWLSRAIAGGDPSASGFLPMPIAIVLGLVAGFAPLLVHIACFFAGAAAGGAKPAVGSHNG